MEDQKQGGLPGMLAQIGEDYRAHGRDWMRPGFQAMAVHRFGVWRMSIKSRLLRLPLSAAYKTAYALMQHYGIELPHTTQVGRRVVIEHHGGIVVHGAAEIGDDCTIRQNVTIGNRRLSEPHDAPRIGARVNVGAGSKILGAVTVGDGATIGANAVVLEDVPAGALAAGIPAKVSVSS